MDSTTSCTSTRRPACCSLTRRSAWPRSSLRSSPWWPADRRVRPGAADGQTGGLGCELLDGAACAGMDAQLFFGPDGERPQEREMREAKATAVCTRCQVRAQCLDYALRNSVKRGMWGGLNQEGTSTGAAPPGTQAERRVTGARGRRPWRCSARCWVRVRTGITRRI
ncbi:MAG TPA: WhiB family transcriptional regulator [Streptosporangiaceae bacterium]|jgi:hypothetical protein|nr:WhiB family transcriptional regulator [Streptosporangiaceae bacterium]